MNRYRLTEAHKHKPVTEEPESMAAFAAADRTERMPKIKMQDERVSKQREALRADDAPMSRRA